MAAAKNAPNFKTDRGLSFPSMSLRNSRRMTIPANIGITSPRDKLSVDDASIARLARMMDE